MWRKPTEQDLTLSISESELTAFRGAATASEELPSMLARGANLIRGYIRGNSEIKMGPDGTIPEALIAPLMDYLAVDVIKRPGIEPSDARTSARKEAIQLFRDVSAKSYQVESYGLSDSASGKGSSTLVQSSDLRFTPDKTEGL